MKNGKNKSKRIRSIFQLVFTDIGYHCFSSFLQILWCSIVRSQTVATDVKHKYLFTNNIVRIEIKFAFGV